MHKVKVYQQSDGRFDWRRRDERGEILSTSGGQGHEREAVAITIALMVNAVPYELEDSEGNKVTITKPTVPVPSDETDPAEPVEASGTTAEALDAEGAGTNPAESVSKEED